MHTSIHRLKATAVVSIIWIFLISGLFVKGQDIVASRDISGGSSVFTFPKSRKVRQNKFRPSRRSKRVPKKRSVAQRKTTRRKIRRQYNDLARVKTRVEKIRVVNPETLPQVKRETPEKASLVFVGVGQYYLNRDDIDKSLEYYREAVSLDQDQQLARLGLSDVLSKKGEIYLDQDENTKAKREFLEALKYNQENSTAYAGLGEIYAEAGEDEKAIENYEKALSIDPEITEINAPLGFLYYQNGRIPEADKYLTKALETDPESAETQYFLGLIRYAQDRNDQALEAFSNALKADPSNAEAQYHLGETLERLGRDQEAIAAYEKAIELNPKYLEPWFSLGVAYYNSDQFEKSANAYSRAVKIKNDYAEAYLNLGDAYRQMAEETPGIREKYRLFQKASSAYGLAVTFIENNKEIGDDFTDDEKDEIYNKYGYVAGQLSILAGRQGIRHTWTKAIDLLTRTTSRNPDAIDFTNLGWAYYNAARIDLKSNPQKARDTLLKAKTNLEKAISMNPPREVLAAARLNLGITHIDLGNFDAAIDNLKPVTKEKKDWAFSNYALGVAYFRRGDHKDAIDQFEDAISIDRDYIQAYSGLGNSYLQRNDEKNVKKVIERLRKLGTRPALNEAKRLQTALSIRGFTRS